MQKKSLSYRFFQIVYLFAVVFTENKSEDQNLRKVFQRKKEVKIEIKTNQMRPIFHFVSVSYFVLT